MQSFSSWFQSYKHKDNNGACRLTLVIFSPPLCADCQTTAAAPAAAAEDKHPAAADPG